MALSKAFELASLANGLDTDQSTGEVITINMDTDVIDEGSSNLYFTDERVDDRVNSLLVAGSSVSLTYDDAANTLTIALDTSGGLDLSNNDTDDLAEGSTNLYYTDTRVQTYLNGGTATSIVTTGNINTGGNLTVTGNLTVNGTTTTVNSSTITVDDPIFTLGGDTAPTADDGFDRGIEFNYHDGTSAKVGFFGWDDSAEVFTFIPDATNVGEVFTGDAGTVKFKDAIFNGTGAVQITSGTTAQRPSSAAQGHIRYNTTDSTFEGYDGSNWGSLGGVKDVDQDTYIIAETSAGTDNDQLQFYTAGTMRMQIGATGVIQFNQAYTFPTADGTANYALVTDGSGALSFADTNSLIDWNVSANYAFKTVVAGVTSLVADSNTDTLTLSAGTDISISGNASTDTAIITNTSTLQSVTDRGNTTTNSVGIGTNTIATGYTLDVDGQILSQDKLVVQDTAFTTAYDNTTGILVDSSNISAGTSAFGTALQFTKLGADSKKAAIVPYQADADSDNMNLRFYISDGNTNTNPVVLALELINSGAVKISDAYTLPTVDGTANYALVTDGNGTVSWGSLADTIDWNNADNYAFKTVTITDTNSGYTWASTGSAVADSNTDTLTFVDGNGVDISVDAPNDAILIQHSDTSSVSNVDNSGNTFIQDLTFDTYGHVTAVASGSVDFNVADNYAFKTMTVTDTDTGYTWTSTGSAVADSNTDTLTFVDGPGVDISVDATSDAIKIEHTDTSSVADLTSAANTFITAQTYDTFGHVTARTTGTVDFDVSANYAFKTIAVSGQTDVVADSNADTLTLVGAGITTITTDATTDTITFTATETDTLQTVTDRGNTTTNSVTIGSSTAPAYDLDVYGTGRIRVGNSTNGHLFTGTSGGDYSQHIFKDNADTDEKFIISYGANHGSLPHMLAMKANNASGSLGFFTNSVERVRIDNTGVGIGTTDPLTKLEIYTADYGINDQNEFGAMLLRGQDTHINIVSSEDGSWGSAINLIEASTNTTNDNVWSIARSTTAGGNNLYFNYGTTNAHNNDTKIVFTNGARVGVGSSSPGAAVDILTGGTNGQSFLKASSASGTRAILASDAQDDGYFYLYDSSDVNQVAFRTDLNHSFIAGGGNVGIGITNPTALFHVTGGIVSGDSTILRIGGGSGSGGNHSAYLEFAESESGGNLHYGFKIYNDGNASNNLWLTAHENSTVGQVALSVDRTEAWVGIGTTDPISNLNIYDADSVNRLTFTSGSGNLTPQHRIEFQEGVQSSAGSNFTIEYEGGTGYGNDGALLFRGLNGATQDQVYGGINRAGTAFFGLVSNVGIGMTDPSSSYKLDVKGNVRLGDPAGASTVEIADVPGANYKITTGGYDLTFSKYDADDAVWATGLQITGTDANDGAPNVSVTNDLSVGGDVTIGGDLTVSGNTTYLNTTNLNVEDAIIKLNHGQATPANDIGMVFQRYSSPTSTNYNVGFVWEETDDRLIFGKTPEDASDNDLSFSTEWMSIYGTGAVTIGVPTGGMQGVLTIKQQAQTDLNGLNGLKIENNSGNTYAGIGYYGNDALTITAGSGATESTNIAFRTATSGNESEKMRIRPDGKVGIGTTNPQALLHIQHTAQDEPFLHVTRYNDANNKPILGALEYDPSGSTAGHLWLGTHNRDMHLGYVLDADTTVDATQSHLTITSAGKVGIGTTVPMQTLQVQGSIYLGPNNSPSIIHAGGTATLSSDGDIYLVADSNDTADDADAGDIIFGGGSNTNTDSNQDFTQSEYGGNYSPRVEWMRIKNGDVGIGTNAPIVADLHVVGARGGTGQSSIIKIGSAMSDTSNHEPRLEFAETGNNTNMTYGFSITGDGATTNNLLFRSHSNSITGTVAMSIARDTANVGIGTTSPDARLDVIQTQDTVANILANGTYAAKFTSSTSGAAGRAQGIILGGVDAVTRGVAILGESQSTSNEHHMIFAVSSGASTPTERVRLTNNGDVGIGTSAPDAKLDVRGTLRVDNAFTFDANEGTSTATASTFTLFAHADYSAAKVLVKAKYGNDCHITELLVTHDGTTAVSTEYGTVITSSILASYQVAINGANVELTATGTQSSGIVYNVVKTLID